MCDFLLFSLPILLFFVEIRFLTSLNRPFIPTKEFVKCCIVQKDPGI